MQLVTDRVYVLERARAVTTLASNLRPPGRGTPSCASTEALVCPGSAFRQSGCTVDRLRRGHRAARDCAGFTFIEMMMTVMLMAIATAMVVPTLSTNDMTYVRAGTWLVVAELDFAQAAAITDPSDNIRVSFDEDAGRVWVAASTTPDEPLTAQYTNAPHDLTLGEDAGAQAVDVLLALSGIDETYVEYDAFGRITSTTQPEITLSRNDASMSIAISTDTGFLTVTEN
ncbi:MAG: pilus assembly FimT family protein [Planctomycetota bacterium]